VVWYDIISDLVCEPGVLYFYGGRSDLRGACVNVRVCVGVLSVCHVLSAYIFSYNMFIGVH